MRMHLYVQAMVEAVNPASGHVTEVLFSRIGTTKSNYAADILYYLQNAQES